MKNWNGNKKIKIEIHSNDLSGCNGHTVWHIVNNERKHAMKRNADGKDFDWMSEKQGKDFYERGKYQFTITASEAGQYFEYIP